MKWSQFQDDTEVCYLCGSTKNLHWHHVYHWSSWVREVCELEGCLVRVCADCHNLSPHAIHNDPKTEKALQRDIQRKWQELNDKTDEDFIKTFGKGYLYE